MGTWTNNDGLYIKFGENEALQNIGGEYEQDGGIHTVEFQINASDLAAVGSQGLLSDTVYIPNNAFIDSAQFRVETAFVGASGTLDFGLVRKNRTTEIDYDGIDSAIAVAALTAGATIACDGALIGTRLSQAGIPTARNNTTDFSAGKGWLRIVYRI